VRRPRISRLLLTLGACTLPALFQTEPVLGQNAAPPSSASDRAAVQIAAQDPAFAAVPFEKWLAEGDRGTFHWSARVSAGELTNHQRLRASLELQVDGSDVAARRGNGYLVMLVEFEDADHRVYRIHGSLDLAQVTDAAAKSNLVYTQDAFVRPGDYRVSVVMFDAKTGDHSALQRKVRANALHNDPLPQSWDSLPAVEFAGVADAPDSWYLPRVTGRLKLPLETRRPVHVEVVVNASPTAFGPGATRSGQVNNRGLADLLPALKVLSQVAVRNGALHVSLLDLTRQSILFDQNGSGDLDWSLLRASLVQADPNKIDARSLARRGGNAQFFVDQMRLRMNLAADAANTASDPLRVGIVLSPPMAFDSGEDRHPIEAAVGSGKLYYFRFHAVPPQTLHEPYVDPFRGGRRNAPLSATTRPLIQEPLDALENLVKPLQPRLFDIYTPEQFRKALSTVLEDVSRM
jgi:hypothetical protein